MIGLAQDQGQAQAQAQDQAQVQAYTPMTADQRWNDYTQSLKDAGRKSALFLLVSPEGENRFVPLTLQ